MYCDLQQLTRVLDSYNTLPLIGEVAYPQAVAGKMAQLKALLPEMDISRLVARCPYLVLFADMDIISTSIAELRSGFWCQIERDCACAEMLLLLQSLAFSCVVHALY